MMLAAHAVPARADAGLPTSSAPHGRRNHRHGVFDGVDRVPGQALDLGISLGGHLDGTDEPLGSPAPHFPLRLFDKPGLHAQLLGNLGGGPLGAGNLGEGAQL